jgi:hypothetical protein
MGKMFLWCDQATEITNRLGRKRGLHFAKRLAFQAELATNCTGFGPGALKSGDRSGNES